VRKEKFGVRRDWGRAETWEGGDGEKELVFVE
jgi:hypothetical protein